MKKIKKVNWWRTIFWRAQFKIVPATKYGRCLDCEGGNPNVECAKFYCPCNADQQLKRIKTYKFLYNETK